MNKIKFTLPLYICFTLLSCINKETKHLENPSSTYKSEVSHKPNLPGKTVDSLPLIPKLFLEHQKKNKEFCLVRGDTSKKQIALTFDDGPTKLTEQILDVLNTHDVKASFFWLGKQLKENISIVNRAKKENHLLANHSWNHENGWESSEVEIWNNQILKAITAFELYGAGKPTYYRPPFGAITQEHIEFLASKGIKTVLWSLTTLDWDTTQNSEKEILKRFKDHLHNGAIILLHDFDFGNSNAKLKALDRMIIYAKSIGFEFVRIDQI